MKSVTSENSAPLVSIFMPTYNHRKFIAEALESCLSQDYNNIEIVVGDDCSDDGTDGVVREFQVRHPDKIVYTRSDTNKGITANANEVLGLCRGDLIAFMSGDDVMLPSKVSRQVAFMQANPGVVICYHDVECYEHDVGRATYNYSDRFPMIVGSLEHLIRGKTFFAGNSVMMRKRSVPKNGFDPRIYHSSDWLFFMEAMVKEGDPDNGIAFVPGVLGRYRRHKTSATVQADDYGLSEFLKALDIIAQRSPTHRELACQVKAERLITQSVKDMLKGRVAAALRHAGQGMAISPLKGPALFTLNLAHYLHYRVTAFVNRA